ncbi:MAG TPA: biotin--[acetyl-CoA-carboxylase] ligase [Xanthobacteraceae bacterium]
MIELDPRASAAGARHRAYDEIDSTNAEALRLMRQGERGPLWITAARQSAGRGRRGRAWASLPGNLHASLLLTDAGPPEHWPQISFVAALAVHDAVVEVAADIRPMLELKWPNDLLLAGGKCAGILIEGEGGEPAEEAAAGVAVGIGVNCVAHPPDAAYPATDLATHGAAVSAATLFAALSVKMPGRLAQWNHGNGFATIRADWLARAAGLGENIRVRLAEGEVSGRFDALDDTGALVLIAPDGGKVVVAAGDVVSFEGSL